MASLTGQAISDSYEQLLTLPDGGGNTTTLVPVTDGDGGTAFALKLSTTSISIDATDRFYLDGDAGTPTTYITESSNGVMDFYADGEILLRLARDDASAIYANKLYIVDENIGTADTSRMTLQCAVSTSGASVVHSIQLTGDAYGDDVLLLGRDDSATSTNVVLNADVGIGTHAASPTGPTVGFQIFKETHVGYDDNGYDVKFFGATAGAYMRWDQANDQLELVGNTDVGSRLIISGAQDPAISITSSDAGSSIDIRDNNSSNMAGMITYGAVGSTNDRLELKTNNIVRLTVNETQCKIEGALVLPNRGAVTQGTSATTAVTLNNTAGIITTYAATLAANTEVQFTLTNSTIQADSLILVSMNDMNTDANSHILVTTNTIASGSYIINLFNCGSGTASATACQIHYWVINNS